MKEIIPKDSHIKLEIVADSFASKYYNDGDRYVTILILSGTDSNEYVFQYAGEKDDWDTSSTSNISIVYAYDKNGNGGSEGNGGLPWYKFHLRKKLIKIFEKGFIFKLEQVLK